MIDLEEIKMPTFQVQYRRQDGSTFLSSPYADHTSAEFIASIGRVTGPSIGIVECVVVDGKIPGGR